jgi:long-chain fatty acid transport protein
MKKFNRLALSTSLLAAMSTSVMAGPYGYDLHNVLAPVSASMAGTSIAKPLDNVSAVFGNPAGLSEFRGTEFTFGATWYKPSAVLEHDGSITGAVGGGAFKQSNRNEGYLVPSIAVTQDLRGLGIPGTLGAGVTATNGIGVEYRKEPNSLGASAELIVLGANFGLSWDLTEKLTVGAAATMTYSMLDLGLLSAAAQTHDIAFKGSLGMTYKLPHATQIGMFYHSELRQDFDDIVQTSPTAGQGLDSLIPPFGTNATFSDGQTTNLIIEQPRTLGIGISNEMYMDGNLYLAADVMFKNYANADFWQDVYTDQWIFSMGAQLTDGPWEYRVGYGYADDPTRENVQGLTQLQNICAGLPASCSAIPTGNSAVGIAVTEYVQAAQAQVIYRHRVSAGVGYKGFLAPFLDLDMHAAYQLKEDRDYGDSPGAYVADSSSPKHTNSEVSSWHAGFALTWHFE